MYLFIPKNMTGDEIFMLAALIYCIVAGILSFILSSSTDRHLDNINKKLNELNEFDERIRLNRKKLDEHTRLNRQ